MEPLFTTRPELDRSGMGFSFMTAFMDQVEVSSEPGKGTIVKMKKDNRKRTKDMDHTIALIQKSHEGDDEARAQIVEENTDWSGVS